MHHQASDPQALLESFVSGRDVPCPSCDYNLRNTSSKRCPECGSALLLRINTPREKTWAWLITVIAPLLPLGFYLTVLAIFGVAIVRESDPSNRWYRSPSPSVHDLKLIATLGGASLIFLVATIWSIRRRERMLIRSLVKRAITASLWATSMFVLHLVALYFTLIILHEWDY